MKLTGLQKVCKLYGRVKCGDVMMVWDYAQDVAIPETQMRANKERFKASENAKWKYFQGVEMP